MAYSIGRSGARPLHQAVWILVVVVPLMACKKSDEDQSRADGEQEHAEEAKPAAVITKPLEQLTKDDVGATCEGIGWQNSGVTFSSSGETANVMASCTKESPDGTPSPDGKKRLRLRIAWFKEAPDGLARRKQDLDGDQSAYEVQGNYVLAVTMHGKPQAESQKILDRLLGK